jgi:ABC-type multidrug transport system ATPase subunit
LSGRVRSTNQINISGNVSVNGERTNPIDFKAQVAYVTQYDTLLSTFTPREALQFSATLRLKGKSRSEIDVITNQTLSSLGLATCADTLIGDEMTKGISGQRIGGI